MHRLRSVDIMSVAKISAVIYAAMALIMVPIFLIAALVGAFSDKGVSAAYGVGVGFVFAILAPVLYALIGFISGAIAAALYNFAAGRFGGGVVVDLEAIAPPVLLPGRPAA